MRDRQVQKVKVRVWFQESGHRPTQTEKKCEECENVRRNQKIGTGSLTVM